MLTITIICLHNMDRFYYKKSRLNQLRGFCYTVQEQCSARKAAFRMNLEPATVTMQIRTLEEELGILLFIRTTNNRLKLTKEGQLFYEIAITQLQAIDGLFTTFHTKLKENNENNLQIAGHYIALTYILPRYIEILLKQKEFKDIKIKLCNIDRKEAFHRLQNKQVDFAFYPSIAQTDQIPIEIEKINLFNYKNVLMLNKKHPLSTKKEILKKDVEKYTYLLLDKYMFYDPSQVIQFKKSNITFENGNWNILAGFVEHNLGITGLSETFLENKNKTNKNIVYKNVDHLMPKMFFSMFLLKNSYIKNSINYLIDLIKQDSDIK
jgi:DNA-binding transcriptional LysR family regulator